MAEIAEITWDSANGRIIHKLSDGSTRTYRNADRAKYVADNADRPEALDDLRAMRWDTRGLPDPRERIRAEKQAEAVAEVERAIALIRPR